MKKNLLIILSVFYLAVASGLSLNYHFCGNKLKKISLFSGADEKGCCGSKEKSKGCCKDKLAFFKIKSEHSSEKTAKINSPELLFDFSLANTASVILAKSGECTFIPEIYPPPERTSEKLFIEFRTLLI